MENLENKIENSESIKNNDSKGFRKEGMKDALIYMGSIAFVCTMLTLLAMYRSNKSPTNTFYQPITSNSTYAYIVPH